MSKSLSYTKLEQNRVKKRFPRFPTSKNLVGKRGKAFVYFVILQQITTIKYSILCIWNPMSRRGPPRQGAEGPAGAVLQISETL